MRRASQQEWENEHMHNPMTEGEALAVLDVDAIASSLVDWMLTKAMPNGDLLHASVACDYAGMANFKRALSKQLRAALREQPEARGVVIERDSRGLISAVYENGKLSAANPEYVVDTRTAAQQPVQEGGGEVTPYGVARASSSGVAALLARNGVLESANRNMRFMAAPPSAPVGVERGAVTVALAKCRDVLRSLLRDKKCGVHYARANAACHEATDALTQQPAQAAPGWKLVPVVATPEMLEAATGLFKSVGLYGCYAAMLAAAPTPPGDDAAGGGS